MRIHVTGASGSGTTTFGVVLAGLSCPVLRIEGDLSTGERISRTLTWLAGEAD